MKKIEINDVIRIGKEASKVLGLEEGEKIEVDHWYEVVNCEDSVIKKVPEIWDDKFEEYKTVEEFFGENCENFLDCEIVGKKAEDFTIFPYWEWTLV